MNSPWDKSLNRMGMVWVVMTDGEIMSILEAKIDILAIRLEDHIKTHNEQFAHLEKYFNLKIESDNCTSCSVVPKLDKIERRIDVIDNWKNLCIGAIIILGVVSPYIIPKLIG